MPRSPVGDPSAPHASVRHRRSAGLSLTEALTVLALVAMAGGLAYPQLTDLVQLQQLKAASGDWARVVRAARTWAFTHHQPARLELQTGPSPCLILHTGARGDCSSCHLPPSCKPGARVLAISSSLPAGVQVSGLSSGQLWNPGSRTVTPTATIKLELPNGRSIHHVVNLAGRVRTCSPDGLASGVPAC
jgi:type IV fimbrial biogenesis protein FimT